MYKKIVFYSMKKTMRLFTQRAHYFICTNSKFQMKIVLYILQHLIFDYILINRNILGAHDSMTPARVPCTTVYRVV